VIKDQMLVATEMADHPLGIFAWPAGQRIPTLRRKVNHVVTKQDKPIAMTIDEVVPLPLACPIGENFDGRGQEAELAADRRPARCRGAGEELGEGERSPAHEDAGEGEPCVQEALAVDDGSPCLANAARDGEPAWRRRQTTDHVGEQVFRQALLGISTICVAGTATCTYCTYVYE
jgi:hypothetical protein